jgi:hypothetical protein
MTLVFKRILIFALISHANKVFVANRQRRGDNMVSRFIHNSAARHA